MAFSGNGTFNYNDGTGTLEYGVQSDLKTFDEKVYSSLNGLRGDFGKVQQTLSSWGNSAVSFYGRGVKYLGDSYSELKSINNNISTLNATITASTNSLLAPLSSMQTDIAVIKTEITSVSKSLSTNTSLLSEIKGNTQDISNQLKNSGNPNVTNISETNIPPIYDSSPDYTNILDNISDVLNDIKGSFKGVDKPVDVSTLYPGFQSDLDKLQGVIGEMVEFYSTSEGFDVDRFTDSVKDVIVSFTSDFVQQSTDVLLTGISDQFSGFIEEFADGVMYQLEQQQETQILRPQEFLRIYDRDYDIQGEIKDIISQFHYDTKIKLQDIDSNFTEGLGDISSSIDRSSRGNRSGFNSVRDSVKDSSDEIDSFESDLGDKISTHSKTFDNIFDKGWNKVVAILGGFISADALKSELERLHKSVTDIIQYTGLSKKEANELRDAVNRNIRNTYGLATFSAEERDLALSKALSAGMTNQNQLQQATEAALLYQTLLPGQELDFNSGWAKQILLSHEKNADAFLESTALIIDDYSNNYYVTADKLQTALSDYAVSIRLFGKDVKSFQDATDTVARITAAQEENNIMSMDPKEFLNRIGWSDISELTETDFKRLANQFGISGAELFDFKAKARDTRNWDELLNQMYTHSQETLGPIVENVLNNGAGAEAQISLLAGYGYDYNQLQQLFDELSSGSHAEFAKDAANTDFTKQRSESDIAQEAKDKAEQSQNLTIDQAVNNIWHSINDDGGVIHRMLTALEGMGISGGIAGAVGGIIGGVITDVLFKGAKGAIKAAVTGEGGAALGTVLKGSFGAIFKGLKGTPGKIGGLFTKAGGLLKKVPTAFSKVFSAIATKFDSIFSKLGSKLGEFTAKLGEFGTKLSELGSKFTDWLNKFIPNIGEKFKGAVNFLKAPVNAAVKGYSGPASKLVKGLGSNAMVGLSVFDTFKDLASGANNSEKWVGGSDYNSKIASGLGGALAGTGSGVSGALTNGLKWASIGTAIAPGLGTAIGGALGAAVGFVGGERLSKGFKTAIDKAGALNDSIDLFLEEHLGIFGHAMSAAKNTVIDWCKNWLGGFYTGFGNILGGLKDGFSKILHGDFIGGLKDIFGGFIEGLKNIVMGPINGIKDIWDDWTMGAKDRIKKRKGEITNASNEADAAQKNLDNKEKDLTKKYHAAKQQTESPFKSNANKARKGMTNLSGMSSYTFTDKAAEDFVMNNNVPIDHTKEFEKAQKNIKRAQQDQLLSDTLAQSTLYGGITDNTRSNAVSDAIQSTYTNVAGADTVTGPIIKDVSTSGPENISTPIVSAINSNMSSVLTVLEKIANKVGANGPQSTSVNKPAPPRQSNSFGNKDNMNSTDVLNYQNLG